MATIIDHLVLQIGLDPKQFNAGAASAAAEVKTVQDQVSYSAGEMVGALQRVAAEFISMFLVVNGVKDVVGLFGHLNEATRQLGIESRNVGESASQLRDWGNISQIAGGKAEDAANSIQGLEKSIFNVKHGFGWDDQLTEFGRLNVDTGAAVGKLRDFHALLLDTAKALESKDAADRNQWVQKLGLQGGIGNAVVEGPAALERYWRQQQSIPQISGADTAAAQRLAEAFTLLEQRIEAWATKILTAVDPAIEGLFNSLASFLTGHQGDVTHGINDIAAWVASDGPKRAIAALTEFAQAVADVFRFIYAFLHPIDTIEKIGGGLVDEAKLGMQRGAGDSQVAGEKNAASAKYGLPKDFWNRDPTPLAPGSADAYAGIIAQQHQALGGDAGDPTWDKSYAALAARNKALSQVPGAAPNPTALQAAQGATASPLVAPKRKKVAGAPSASTVGAASITVTGDIFIQTQAKDANGIASAINGALGQKLADGAPLH